MALSLAAVLAAALLVGALAAAPAQAAGLRSIPDEARKAVLDFDVDAVRLDRKTVALAAGAQIRDADNRILPPSHLRGRYRVRVIVDGSGQLHRVWILTDEEAAAPEPRRSGGAPRELSQ